MKNKSKLKIFLMLILIIVLLLNQIVFAEENKDINKVKLEAVLTPMYVIGPGDELTIIDRTLREVFGQVEQYTLKVSTDGYISIPLPDGKQENLLAAGYTLNELSKEVRELFGRTLKNPLVFVQISRYRPLNIYIGGEIVKPGVYKIEPSASTVGVSISEAIQLAGGLKPRANIKALIITRGSNAEKKSINLHAYLSGEDPTQDINLQPGDTIYANPAENQADQAQSHVKLLGKLAYQDVPISITGEVKTSGNYNLTNDASFFDAIGKAGGLTNVGSLKKVKVSRYDDDGVYRIFKVNINDLLLKGATFDQIALRPNDTIEIEASKVKQTKSFFRQVGVNLIPIVAGAASASFGQFVVQDNLFNRSSRLRGSTKASGSGGNFTSPITIIGNTERIINENSK
ncbi:MAG: SLBB domain-containing protein [Candidatus Melainabacteria bacterium]|nr:SLBB domain-containing protein [Candidatus Melainabacteria bacterium]